MTDPFAALYPAEAQETPVLDGVPAPSFAPYSTGFHDGTRPEPDYSARLLARAHVGRPPAGDSLAFVDKLFPHTPLDLMVVADDQRPRFSFADLQPRTGEVVCRILHQFVDFLSREDILAEHQLSRRRVHICYNFDPHTIDRDNPMAYDKRFHVHLNCWRRATLDQAKTVRFGSITDPVSRRDLLDPLGYVGPRLCFEMLKGTVSGLAMMAPDPERDLRLRLPAGLKFVLGEWQSLRTSRLPELLRALHGAVVAVYGAVGWAFTDRDDAPVPWSRHALLPSAEIERRLGTFPALTAESRRLLLHLALALRSVGDRQMAFLRRHRELRTRCLALAGPAYSLGFYSPVVDDRDPCLLRQGPVYLVLQPKMFSRLGGAGLAYLDEFPAVRVARGAHRMSAEEEQARTQFQRSFLAHVQADLTRYPEVTWDPPAPAQSRPPVRREAPSGARR